MDDETRFPRVDGPSYLAFLDAVHRVMAFGCYLEIGCRTGRTIAPVRGPTIAVDPFFKVESNVIGAKPSLLLFQQKSDDFFASRVLEKLGIRVSFAFLDGLHLFEYLLRDFINTEAHSRPEGVIALHDCVPFGEGMLTRDLENLPRGAWTGDVWKLIPILQSYRPDLKITVLNCEPTGLVLISGLDPANTVLRQAYDQIVADWTDVDLVPYGLDRFFGSFALTDARAYAKAGFADFRRVARRPDTVKTPVPVSP